jgi:hypothetical protein
MIPAFGWSVCIGTDSGSVSAWWIFAALALSERFRFRRHIRQRSGRVQILCIISTVSGLVFSLSVAY